MILRRRAGRIAYKSCVRKRKTQKIKKEDYIANLEFMIRTLREKSSVDNFARHNILETRVKSFQRRFSLTLASLIRRWADTKPAKLRDGLKNGWLALGRLLDALPGVFKERMSRLGCTANSEF